MGERKLAAAEAVAAACQEGVAAMAGRTDEPITSRPKLLSAVGRMTSHAGQKKILLTITHEAARQIKTLIANVRAGLSQVRVTAPQLDKTHRWIALVRYIIEEILACQPKQNLGLTALASG